MRLYLKRRVEKAEGKQTFAEAKGIAAKRSQAGKVARKSANITKREKLLERVRTLQVTVDAMPLKRLLDELPCLLHTVAPASAAAPRLGSQAYLLYLEDVYFLP
jgi:hypothetical protein